jgi:quercetin dioxygenase-like cupin family protein
MTDPAHAAIPADDPNRKLTVADPDSSGVRHVAVVGDTYSILVSGADTAGRYCLIDMIVPDGGGPPPHRHDFEEMFTLLEGELEFTFRGETKTVRAGSTVNIPANAPHVFRNASGGPVRMLCMATRGPGRLLSRGRRPAGEPRVAAAQARQGADGSADQDNQGARAEIPHRAADPLIERRAGRRPYSVSVIPDTRAHSDSSSSWTLRSRAIGFGARSCWW